MSGVNGNVIMSGYGDENPDDKGREAAGLLPGLFLKHL
jgi:hypothetical protein